MATQAAACGVRPRDHDRHRSGGPSAVRGVVHAVNFVGEKGGTITGAQNIPVAGCSHMGIMESPEVQERILSGSTSRL